MKFTPSPTSVRENMEELPSSDSKGDEELIAKKALPVTTESELTTDDHEQALYPVEHVRSHIMQLSVLVGKLSAAFLEHVPMDPTNDDGVILEESRKSIPQCSDLSQYASELIVCLEKTADELSLNVPTCISKKMELNRRKYPVELCKGRAGKYTEYSTETGITKDEGQSTLHLETELSVTNASLREALPELTLAIRCFAAERNWSKYHLPRNLLLALMGELGELAELFQWSKDEYQRLSRELVDKAGQEIADVAIYLIRLSDVCGIDLVA